MPKILVCTGGGDCPGLNAVLRGIAKAAKQHKEYEIWGSKEAFNGLMSDPPDLIRLNTKRTAGIHVKGGTILKTTNRGNPLAHPVLQPDGSYIYEDRCPALANRIRELGFDAVINIGGDGSQRISQALVDNGIDVVGVPKTIDNDLKGTDLTFGFSTAVQTATDCFDRLVTTAESHHRVMIMEVMGRDAGWIALHTAIAGGAEICLIPEIHYDVAHILRRIERRYRKGKGFINIVIAEGARPKDGQQIGNQEDVQDGHIKLGGIGVYLRAQLEELGCQAQIRTAVLGHIQRGGTPVAYDRILASAMGVRAFKMVQSGEVNRLVSLQGQVLGSAPLSEAAVGNKFLYADHFLVQTARELGIVFGD